MRIYTSAILLVLTAAIVSTRPAYAAGTVQLNLLGDTRGQAMLFQEWGQALGKAGIRNVRIQAVEESGPPSVDVQGTADHPVYVVTGIIVSRDELALPTGRFRRADLPRLAQWLKELAERGPNAEKEEKVAFGLTAAQLKTVRNDLSAPVGFNTTGLARREAVERIARQLKLSLPLEENTLEALADDKVEDELTDLTCGTALACLLRPAGRCFVPRESGGQLAYAVVKLEPGVETWPIGWDIDQSPRDALPILYEFHNVNIENATVAATVAAIAKIAKAPVLWDHYALTRLKIDPAKVVVSLPRSRTTYSLTLGKLLFKARLKFDVRLDEAGSPLIWITTIKKA